MDERKTTSHFPGEARTAIERARQIINQLATTKEAHLMNFFSHSFHSLASSLHLLRNPDAVTFSILIPIGNHNLDDQMQFQMLFN